MRSTLITNWYNPGDKTRRGELEHCLENNLALPFDRFVLLSECDPPHYLISRCKTKVVTRRQKGRPLFSDFLRVATAQPAQDQKYVFLNSDIALSPEILNLLPLIGPRDFCCITRHEISGKVEVSAKSSQDCWAFQSSLFPESLLAQCQFPIGHMGAENRFANILHCYGFRLFNPCRSILIQHLDRAAKDYSPNLEQSKNRIFGAYTFVHAGDLKQIIDSREHVEHMLYTVPLDLAFRVAASRSRCNPD